MATVFDVIFWALVSSIPLVVGAVLAVFLKIPQKIVAIIMALGSGALISVITFSLMREAYHMGGVIPVSIGFRQTTAGTAGIHACRDQKLGH